jgi:hypothetical protein
MVKITRTQDEINTEIAKLKAMKPKIRKTTFFGDDNLEAIQADIDLLTDPEHDIAKINEEGTDEFSEHLQSTLEATLNWLEGDDTDGTPSEQWASLIVE